MIFIKAYFNLCLLNFESFEEGSLFLKKMSSKQQPFSFQSIALGRKSATTTSASETSSPEKIVLEKLYELYHKKFLEKVKEWNRVHEKSIEHFSEYIQLIQLLNRVKPNTENELSQSLSNDSTMMDISITKKLKQAHASLLECIEECRFHHYY